MRVWVLSILILAGDAWAGPAQAQGPVPPAFLPERLRAPVDGYDMNTPFQLWRMSVEGQKGEAIRLALEAPPVVEGHRQIGRTFLTYAYNGDMGVFRRGEVRTFCPTRADWSFEPANCFYVYRSGSVPLDAAVYGATDNPVARWTRERFDETRVAERLAEAGVRPDADMWRVDRAVMLAGQPSALPILSENLEVVTVDSRACPALRDAVHALDRATIEWRTDVMAVGDDAPLDAPRPHSVTGSYTLEIFTGRSFVSLGGDDEALWNIVSPVIRAADGCAAR